jgi:GWxTD domain-containing protein
MKILKLLIRFCLMISMCVILYSQNRDYRDLKSRLDYGKKFYADIYVLPNESADSVDVIIPYKIANETLTFIKSVNDNADRFLSVPDVEAEFKDSDGIIRRRIFREDSIFVNSFEETNSAKDFMYGFLHTSLKCGKYSAVVELSCSNSQLKRSKEFHNIDCKSFWTGDVVAEPVLASKFNTDSVLIHPYILEMGIPFSSGGASILIPVSSNKELEKFSYKISYIAQKDVDFEWSPEFSFTGFVSPIKNTTLKIISDSVNKEITLALSPIYLRDSTITHYPGLIGIDVPAERLVPGTYELSLLRARTADTIKRSFRVVWEDMPLILSDPETAVDAMYYILSDKEYDLMKTGNSKDISKKLLEYWKAKDPTKDTPFNEAMAEYFSRVEYAYSNFRTLAAKNGYKTDRGKIYILYGPPTSVNKTLGDKMNTEIWKYDRLKKDFVFETDARGNYILVKINDIK